MNKEDRIPTYPEFLEAAKDIRDGHWCQGNFVNLYRDEKYAYCAVGWVRYITGYYGPEEEWEGTTEVIARLTALTSVMYYKYPGFHDIIMWNDAPERTKEEVAELFEEAAYYIPTKGQSTREKGEIRRMATDYY